MIFIEKKAIRRAYTESLTLSVFFPLFLAKCFNSFAVVPENKI